MLSEIAATTELHSVEMTNNKVYNFYREYYGHRLNDLDTVHSHIRRSKPGEEAGIIFLVGDSTLDNKHWFQDTADAVNGYEEVLHPPLSIKDVSYWMNLEIVKRGFGNRLTAINCAEEESTIGGRGSPCCGSLSEHDIFARNNIRPNDILVISMGGNDIALRPSPCTAISILSLLCCSSASCVRAHACGAALPCDDGCGLCGCVSNLIAWPPGYGHLLHLFGTRLRGVAAHLIAGPHKPRRVLLSMVYFPDMQPGHGSWADSALAALGYDRDPARLQELIRRVFLQVRRVCSRPQLAVGRTLACTSVPNGNKTGPSDGAPAAPANGARRQQHGCGFQGRRWCRCRSSRRWMARGLVTIRNVSSPALMAEPASPPSSWMLL